MSHVMLVEDHACFRQALGMALRRYTDFGISTRAGSLVEGRTCLSADKAEQIDAAIINIRLPDGNGADLIAEIGVLRTAVSRIPMMALTVIRDPELHDRWRSLGAVEVVSKAASSVDFLAATRRLRRQREAVHEDQRVSDIVNRDLFRQASIRSKWTDDPVWARSHRREVLPLEGSSDGGR
ncbi:MAG TPA: response regulator [Rubrobacter sp.]|nr:response regulator [Rubrobacter sp.]